MRTPFRLSLALLVVASTVPLASHVSAAEEREGAAGAEIVPIAQCTNEEFERAPDGTYRQSFDAVEDQGAIAVIPPRTAAQVGPGESSRICVGFQNRTRGPVTLKLSTFDVGVDEDGAPMSTGEKLDYGASSWLTIPTDEIRDIAKGDVAWMVVDVDVPKDATAGSWYASIKATIPAPKSEGTGVQVVQSRAAITQVFFDIPGEVARGGRVVDLRSPRVVWWDGLGVGELPVLDRLRGLGIAPIRFDWHNTGDYTDMVGGAVQLESDLGGRKVADLELDERAVLRGERRAFETVWADDIPLMGRFTPTLRMRGSDGRAQTIKLDPIWVIPSWWYLVLVMLAIGLPVWWRRRSSRRYEELLARVEAAEGRGAAETDEDSWDDEGDWREGR